MTTNTHLSNYVYISSRTETFVYIKYRL